MLITPELFIIVIVLAVGIGFLASLFGIGGGFLLVPTMILILEMDTHLTVGTSAFIILFMSLSSSLAYARQRRIDYLVTIIIVSASIIGSVLGAFVSVNTSGQIIIVTFGVVEVFLALILGLKKTPQEKKDALQNNESKSIKTEIATREPSNITPITKRKYIIHRNWTDRMGLHYEYTANILIAYPLSFIAGFLSSMLGIGGGTLFIQIFVFVCAMPIHMAIASSMFMIFLTSISSTITYVGLAQIDFIVGIAYAIGMVVGAQLGAFINKKIKSTVLKRLAAIMIVIIAVRMIIFAFIDA
jgi:uncharacterized membrane protein YfcA